MRILNTAATGVRAQQTALDILGNNMANVNTPGYKAQRVNFAEALAAEMRPAEREFNGQPVGERIDVGAGVIYPAISTDYRQGIIRETENPFDLAIDGEGFFPVRTANGESRYTRVGNFELDGQGKLVNSDGYILEVKIPADAMDLYVDETGNITGFIDEEERVLGRVVVNDPEGEGYPVGPIDMDELGRPLDWNGDILPTAFAVPEGAEDIQISTEGVLSATIDGNREILGQINIITFANPEGLVRDGDNLYFAPDAAGVTGDELVGAPGSQVEERTLGKLKTQSLEQSNVNLASAMTEMIQVQRAYQLNARMITNGDQMWSMANSLRR
ncbi:MULTISPECIES: flagellar hook-basal body protein [Desulfitobacterium]|uniref:Flagellar hook-basal body protein n=1 Tax=Desulfitobacterium dehalogenans (strain ATCC 51507 / DSM 9161 / JW/IU-DC1) TaxID=756499 RepID=I4ACU6_DESDJ|nr:MULTISPECIES: flagellar hook-basal body protein [Desulfitobacterium]AFM01781.1 flagellar hook-basal body protein [Desulfitobacterium dehalogenans ATCC 51507]